MKKTDKTGTNPHNISDIMRRYFTLIELLIVIAILAILAGMLLPALGKARLTARRVACTNQIRQWGTAFLQYGIEYNDFLLPYASGSTVTGNKGMNGPNLQSWNMFLAPYVGIDMNNVSYLTNRMTSSVPKSCQNGIMKCPASSVSVNQFNQVQYGIQKYNVGGVEAVTGHSVLTKFGRARMPSKMALLLDSAADAPNFPEKDAAAADIKGTYGVTPAGKGISRNRHGGAANIVFLDGHAETWREKALAREKASTQAEYKVSVMFGIAGNM